MDPDHNTQDTQTEIAAIKNDDGKSGPYLDRPLFICRCCADEHEPIEPEPPLDFRGFLRELAVIARELRAGFASGELQAGAAKVWHRYDGRRLDYFVVLFTDCDTAGELAEDITRWFRRVVLRDPNAGPIMRLPRCFRD